MHVSDLLSASDIAILCSHQEGFWNVILEGMSAGLPLIVTDVEEIGRQSLPAKPVLSCLPTIH
jgi:glycosyltransferase involved in cell wall biosynthesis